MWYNMRIEEVMDMAHDKEVMETMELRAKIPKEMYQGIKMYAVLNWLTVEKAAICVIKEGLAHLDKDVKHGKPSPSGDVVMTTAKKEKHHKIDWGDQSQGGQTP
jgi:hypothetical protein